MNSKTLLNESLLPKVEVEAIVCHWTGGARRVSSLDLAHYHFIIDGNCDVHRGNRSVANNIPPLRAGSYAAHTRGFNAANGKAVIGVAVCGMAGARSWPFAPGPHPITEEQIDTMARVVAQLCRFYNVPVNPRTVLQHGEVQKNRGKIQLGKWDVCAWPWAPKMTSAQVCDAFRAKVALIVKELKLPWVKLPPVKTLELKLRDSKVFAVSDAKLIAGHWMTDGKNVALALQKLTGRTYSVGGIGFLRSHLTTAGFVVTDGYPSATGDVVIVKEMGR